MQLAHGVWLWLNKLWLHQWRKMAKANTHLAEMALIRNNGQLI